MDELGGAVVMEVTVVYELGVREVKQGGVVIGLFDVGGGWWAKVIFVVWGWM